MEVVIKVLAKRLRQARKNKKLTQEQLAHLVKTTKGTISNYENEYSTPSNEMLKDLAKALDVTTDYLLGNDSKNEVINQLNSGNQLSPKEEHDIARRMEKIKRDLMEANNSSGNDGLNFYGEPMSEEAVESLLESLEVIVRQTQRINKKYIPKKYRKDDGEDKGM